jgi:hypothetical protein
MNNTKTLAVVAVLMAATLVVGTFVTVATTQSAFAYAKKPRQDDNKKTRDNGSGNRNGNTVTVEECENRGSASGFDTALDQECENLICTHPGTGATCVSEGGNRTAGGGEGTSDPCLTCFTQSLSVPEQNNFVNLVASQFGFKVSSIPDICKIINTGTVSGEQIVLVLNTLLQKNQITEAHALALLDCLVQAGLISADTDSIRRL